LPLKEGRSAASATILGCQKFNYRYRCGFVAGFRGRGSASRWGLSSDGVWQQRAESIRAKRAGGGVKTQRLVFFFVGQNLRFCALFGGLFMPVNRALKAARVPCALFAALEAKRPTRS
jgi:hypothetical protein